MPDVRDFADQITQVITDQGHRVREKGSQHNLRFTIPVAPKGIDRKELDGY